MKKGGYGSCLYLICYKICSIAAYEQHSIRVSIYFLFSFPSKTTGQ